MMDARPESQARAAKPILLAGSGLVLAGIVGIAASQSSENFELRRTRIAAGAGEFAGTTHFLRSTFAQHDAGHSASQTFEIRGGFWFAAAAPQGGTAVVFSDGFEEP